MRYDVEFLPTDGRWRRLSGHQSEAEAITVANRVWDWYPYPVRVIAWSSPAGEGKLIWESEGK